jgi:hypothetical protein
MNPAGTKIQENKMLRLLMCFFGLHGVIEIDYTIDGEEIKVCRDCLKGKALDGKRFKKIDRSDVSLSPK